MHTHTHTYIHTHTNTHTQSQWIKIEYLCSALARRYLISSHLTLFFIVSPTASMATMCKRIPVDSELLSLIYVGVVI